MSDELVLRSLTEEDYEVICDWWIKWKWPVLPKELLPHPLGPVTSIYLPLKIFLSIV